jgi:hypothetical protein
MAAWEGKCFSLLSFLLDVAFLDFETMEMILANKKVKKCIKVKV